MVLLRLLSSCTSPSGAWVSPSKQAAARPEKGRSTRRPGPKVIGHLGCTGLDDDPDNPVVITGYKAARTKPLTPAKKQVNRLIASVRAVCEHAFAHLKNWRVLTKLRLDVRHATTLLRALLVLTNLEVTR